MSNIKLNIIELLLALKENPYPHPAYLIDKLQAPLETIEEAIDRLIDFKISIHNFQWKTCFSPINLSKLEHNLAWKNIEIDYQMHIPSTHLYLKEDKKTCYTPMLCIAEYQSAGIGQRQKSWASPFGNNLYFSLKINTKLQLQKLSGLSLVIGISIVKALQIPELKIKWPNDIYAHHQKLAGILIDLGQAQKTGISIIISIGINVNQMDAMAIDNQWTSLQKITGTIHHRTTILIKILNQIKDDLASFEANGLKAFQGMWQNYDYLYQKDVVVQQADNILYGQAMGIDEHGRLKLLNNDAKLLYLNCGEVSIKPQ